MFPLPALAQTKFALTRQADHRSAESGERVRVRGMHCEDLFGFAEPPHPNLLPRGEKERRSDNGSGALTCPDTPAAPRRCPTGPGRCLPSRRGRSG
ncbi:hypothetical protein FZ942_21670 [Azospirillum lipoferum]|uniref:Uncharacterized protein n=1 Tax=Azospirillum lipoferum TaxID=193 RepID=A0A5A9GJW6_AZOLI|nr:hypothetical protein FZ942_21670 [Azospirillum lipoferum]